MKNVKMLLLLIGVMLLVTGCGGKYKAAPKELGDNVKVLSCDVPLESEEGNEEVDTEELLGSKIKFVFDTKTKKIINTRYELEYDYSEVLKEVEGSKFASSMLEWGLDAICSTMENEGYKGCSYYEKKGIYIFTMDLGDASKFEQIDINSMNANTIEDVKTFMENTKYFKGKNCTIE